jgi:hypothetical protein
MVALRSIAAGLLFVAMLYVVFVAVVGYGFGQLFFGDFQLIGSVCGLSALGSVAGIALCAGRRICYRFVAILSAIAVICVALEAIDYYRNLDIAGNNFGWEMQGPFVVCLVAIGAAALFGNRDHRPNKSLERTREG